MRTYVCMYECMHVCVYVRICLYLYIYIYIYPSADHLITISPAYLLTCLSEVPLGSSSSASCGCKGSFRLEWETSPSSKCATGPLEGSRGCRVLLLGVGLQGLCAPCFFWLVCYNKCDACIIPLPGIFQWRVISKLDVALM